MEKKEVKKKNQPSAELRNKSIKFYNVDQVDYERIWGKTNEHTSE